MISPPSPWHGSLHEGRAMTVPHTELPGDWWSKASIEEERVVYGSVLGAGGEKVLTHMRVG